MTEHWKNPALAPSDWEEAYARFAGGATFPPDWNALKVAFIAGMTYGQELGGRNSAEAFCEFYLGKPFEATVEPVKRAPTCCGYCRYEESDGVLEEQCGRCKAIDAAAKPKGKF